LEVVYFLSSRLKTGKEALGAFPLFKASHTERYA
jgi:hypothetical protein